MRLLRNRRTVPAVLLSLAMFSAELPTAFALPQGPPSGGPQTRPAPSTRPSPGNNGGGRPPSRPNPGNGGNRPQPQPSRPTPNPGTKPSPPRPQPQPSRPNPGNGNNRPPTRPNPGNGNNRPPNRPNPGNGNNRPNPPRPGNNNRPRPPGNYNFRPNDRDRMRRYYQRNLGYINRSRRPHFVMGGFIPFGYRTYFTPIPPHLLGYLPPPPPGYAMGYYDGYCVVYDPVSFAILSLVDLLD